MKASKTLLLSTCAALFFLLLYLNYNFPTVQQLFANKFYQKTTISFDSDRKQKSGNNFSCIAVSCVVSDSIYNTVKYPCSGSARISGYYYVVNSKIYDLKRRNYFNPRLGCSRKAITHAYYFPLFPNWSVGDKSQPSDKALESFEKSSYAVSLMLIIYLLGFLLHRHLHRKKEIDTKLWSPNKKFTIITLALSLPFIMRASYIFLFYTVFETKLPNFFDNTLFLLFNYLPSAILLVFYPLSPKWKIILIPMVVCFLFFFQNVAEVLILLLFGIFNYFF